MQNWQPLNKLASDHFFSFVLEFYRNLKGKHDICKCTYIQAVNTLHKLSTFFKAKQFLKIYLFFIGG